MKERRMELREIQEMLELKRKLESQEYFTFSQAARLMGVSRQYVYKLVKEDKLIKTFIYKLWSEAQSTIWNFVYCSNPR